MANAAPHEGTGEAPTRQSAQPGNGVATLPLARRFHRARHVQQTDHSGTVILFDGKTYFTLANETANDLWALLSEPRSAEELVEWIYGSYDAPREVVAADVVAQLALLDKNRLVVEVREGEDPVPQLRRWWQFWWRAR